MANRKIYFNWLWLWTLNICKHWNWFDCKSGHLGGTTDFCSECSSHVEFNALIRLSYQFFITYNLHKSYLLCQLGRGLFAMNRCLKSNANLCCCLETCAFQTQLQNFSFFRHFFFKSSHLFLFHFLIYSSTYTGDSAHERVDWCVCVCVRCNLFVCLVFVFENVWITYIYFVVSRNETMSLIWKEMASFACFAWKINFSLSSSLL